MQFRQVSPTKQKAPPNKKRKSGESRQNSTLNQRGSNPIARKRSEQQIMAEVQVFDGSPWGDTDEDTKSHNEDPIELSEDELPLAVQSKKRRITLNTVPQPNLGGGSEESSRKTTISPPQECFSKLQKLRSLVGHVD